MLGNVGGKIFSWHLNSGNQRISQNCQNKCKNLIFSKFLFQGDITQFQHKQFTEFLLVVESVVGGGDIQQNALEVNNAEAVEEVIL